MNQGTATLSPLSALIAYHEAIPGNDGVPSLSRMIDIEFAIEDLDLPLLAVAGDPGICGYDTPAGPGICGYDTPIGQRRGEVPQSI